jgi:hypothetical protein
LSSGLDYGSDKQTEQDEITGSTENHGHVHSPLRIEHGDGSHK